MRRFVIPLAVIVVLAFGSLAATLVAGNEPALGLDLQGGASVVLQPPDAVEDDEVLDQAIAIIRNRVDALGVSEPEITRQGDAVVVQLPGVNDSNRAVEIVGQTAELQFRPVLQELPPEGVEIPTPDEVPTEVPTTLAPGTEVPTTSAPGTEAPTTSAPAEDAPAPAEDAPGTTGAPDTTEGALGDVDFRLASTAQETPSTTAAPPTTVTAPTDAVPPEAEPPITPPPIDPSAIELTPRDDIDPDAEVVLEGTPEVEGDPAPRYVLGPTAVRGEAVDTARAALQGTGPEWAVDLEFTDEGGPAFDAVAATCSPPSETCPAGQLAIVLDGIVQSAPVIQQASFGGTAQITGGYDQAEARDAALVLRYGALPVQLEQQSSSTVSPSLGRDSLRAGLLAGGIGTALVLLYMILYYRALGLVVVLGLAVWFSLQWSIISYLGATRGLALSLAGVTGIIVSVGVTVDSYVVYFERLRDEVRAGKSVRSSVDRGFQRAFRTIWTADISAFIGAVLLYLLTVGPVRGFAFFLGLSTILDLVVAYFFTRPLVALLGRRQVFTTARFLGVARGLGSTRPSPAPTRTPATA